MSSRQFHIDKSLSKMGYCSILVGIPLGKSAETIKKKILFLFNFFWMNSDFVGAIYWFIDGACKGQSFISLTYAAPCITLTIIANVKAICFLIYNKHVDELIHTMKGFEEKQDNERDLEKMRIIGNETVFLHLVLKLLNFFNWSLIISFPLMPMGMTMYNLVKTNEFHALLPLLVKYPFDAYDAKFWPFVCFKQIWSTLIVVFEIATADYFFYICSTHIRIQFKLLAYELERCAGQLQVEDQRRARFVELVEWHQVLIRSVSLLEVIYAKSTLLNFVSSSVIICLTGFNVTTVDDTAFTISFLSFLFTGLLQIFSLCFFGDMLMRASMEVSDAAYNCQWYATESRLAKMIILVLVRAQEPCKITSLGFADVNLMAFSKILSTAYSYFALLRTVYTSPHD